MSYFIKKMTSGMFIYRESGDGGPACCGGSRRKLLSSEAGISRLSELP